MSPAALPLGLKILLWSAGPLLLFGAICWLGLAGRMVFDSGMWAPAARPLQVELKD